MNLLKTSLFACLCANACHEAIAAENHPNIILIMTDQQSFNTISAYRQLYDGGYSQTPNIDRLVKDGVSFTQTYCSNPVSVPSRFSLFTGKYGGAYGIRENRCRGVEESTVRPMLETNGMGNVFTKGGYETVYGGKVHLPFSGRTGNSKFAAPAGYGFQTYLTKDEREELSRVTADFIAHRKSTDKPLLLVSSFLNPHDICLESSTNLSTVIKGDKADKIKTVQMLRERAATYDSLLFYREIVPDLPFNFAQTVGYPDTKLTRKRFLDFPDWYWKKYRWTYAELVSIVDAHIGRILDALDANPELKKNTIVVFTSDHGEMQAAHHSVTKSLPYEECQRVPLIFSGKGIPLYKFDDSLVCNGIDLMPTLCDLAGIEKPAELDGVSLIDRIKGKDIPLYRQSVFVESEWFVSQIMGHYKYTLFDKDGDHEVLIDLLNDPGEMKNVLESSGDAQKQLDSFRLEMKKHIENYPTALVKAPKKKKK